MTNFVGILNKQPVRDFVLSRKMWGLFYFLGDAGDWEERRWEGRIYNYVCQLTDDFGRGMVQTTLNNMFALPFSFSLNEAVSLINSHRRPFGAPHGH